MENDESITGVSIRQACAACKHQRKKCSQNCLLSPFFPAEKNQQFQAVHKLYGVSNVSKILRNLPSFDERKKAIDSLTWEAQCRESDPVLGCYGQYSKVVNELQLLKKNQQLQQVNHNVQNMMNNKTILIEYYSGTNNNGITNGGGGSGGTGVNVNYTDEHMIMSGNISNNYLQSNISSGIILEPIHQHGYGSMINGQGQGQGQEKRLIQRREINGQNIVCLPNSFNQSQQYYYDPGKI